LRFFLDNTTPPRFAPALQALEGPGGHEVRHLRDMFSADTPDIEWLMKLAKEGAWVIISGDIRISQNEFERRAWLESGLTAFFLGRGWTKLKLWEQAWKLIKWWPDIVAQAERVHAGAGFVIPVSGSKLTQLRV
jgi:hypothetical protein